MRGGERGTHGWFMAPHRVWTSAAELQGAGGGVMPGSVRFIMKESVLYCGTSFCCLRRTPMCEQFLLVSMFVFML